MNPELMRQFWLEISPRRLLLMAGVMGLVILAIYLFARGQALGPALIGVGSIAFWMLAVVWASHAAARSLVAEVREKTWDIQRLSSLSPASMYVGKLIGGVAYPWFGALIALGAVLAGVGLTEPAELREMGFAWRRLADGPLNPVNLAVDMALPALLANAVALGSALAIARRRRVESKMGILPFMFLGILAHWLASGFLQLGGVGDMLRGLFVFGSAAQTKVAWWGVEVSARTLSLATVAALLGWAVMGGWRLMRLELQMRNAPIVWPAFVAFVCLYLAGYATALPALAWVAALLGATVMTYGAVLFEPKDAVAHRRLLGALGRGRIGEAAGLLPAFSFPLAAAAVAAAALFALGPIDARSFGLSPTQSDIFGELAKARIDPFFGLAVLGFLFRDVGVFLFYHYAKRQKRGDFAAIVTLVLLYVVGAAVFGALGGGRALPLVGAQAEGGVFGLVAAWAQAALIWALAIMRFNAGRPRPEAPGAALPAAAA